MYVFFALLLLLLVQVKQARKEVKERYCADPLGVRGPQVGAVTWGIGELCAVLVAIIVWMLADKSDAFALRAGAGVCCVVLCAVDMQHIDAR